MNFSATPRDVLLLLLEELNVSPELSAAIVQWLKLPPGELQNFSADLLRSYRSGAEIIYHCRIAGEIYSVLLIFCIENQPDRDVKNSYDCSCLKKYLKKYFPDLKSAFIAPQALLDKLAVKKEYNLIIPAEQLREYFLASCGRRGKFIVDIFDDAMNFMMVQV